MSTDMSADPHSWERQLQDHKVHFITCQNDNNLSKIVDLNSYLKTNITLLSSDDELPAEAREWLTKAGKDLVDSHQSIADKAEGGMEKFKSDDGGDDTDLENEMRKIRDDTKKASNETVDSMFDRVLAFIKTLAKKVQKKAVSLWRQISDAFATFWAEAWGWIEDAARKVATWFMGVWEEVKASFEKVRGCLQNAWKTIENIF